MNDGDPPPPGPGAAEPRISQQAYAARRGKVIQSARDQYIFNLGSVLWVTIPTVLVVLAALVITVIHSVDSANPVVYGAKRSPGSARGQGAPARGHGASSRNAAPLAVAVSYDQNDVSNGQGSCMSWMFKRPVSALPPPSVSTGANETWAHRYGGIDEGGTNFKLGVQGLTSNAVELTDLRVIDVQRVPLFEGTGIISSDGCGPSVEAGFYLGIGDKPPTVTKAVLDAGAAKALPFPFVVSNTDIQQFQISAGYTSKTSQQQRTCGCIIKWRLALDWSYKGRTGTTVIDDNGQPFETMFPRYNSNSQAPVWFPANGSWRRF